MTPSDPVIRLDEVSLTYSSGLFGGRRGAPALQSVTFEVPRGSITGVVGESGSGKSTIGKIVLGLLSPEEGRVKVLGENPSNLRGAVWRLHRRRVQAVFQDSGASLNPRRDVASAIREGLDIHGIGTQAERTETVMTLLEDMGLGADYAARLPHTLSGGQRQRVNIARALAVEPEVLVADEPVSALDISVQAQILRLLTDQHRNRQLTVIFISHDLAVVREICDRIMVIRCGVVLEAGKTEDIVNRPRHPYTMELMAGQHFQSPRA